MTLKFRRGAWWRHAGYSLEKGRRDSMGAQRWKRSDWKQIVLGRGDVLEGEARGESFKEGFEERGHLVP